MKTKFAPCPNLLGTNIRFSVASGFVRMTLFGSLFLFLSACGAQVSPEQGEVCTSQDQVAIQSIQDAVNSGDLTEEEIQQVDTISTAPMNEAAAQTNICAVQVLGAQSFGWGRAFCLAKCVGAKGVRAVWKCRKWRDPRAIAICAMADLGKDGESTAHCIANCF